MTAVLRAEAPVYGGYVIARQEGVVFIKGAVPGEVVEVEVREKKRDYSVAVVTEVVEPSAFRVEPPCPYFGECGGCHLQYMSYERQVSVKGEVLTDCLRRIGALEIELAAPMYGPAFGYRHRAQFKVSKDGLIGFYKEGTREVVGIDRCPLMVDGLNDIYARVRRADLSGIREIHITCGESCIALLKGVSFDEDRAERFMEMGFSGVAFDDGSYRGTGHVEFDLNGLRYTISPWGFFQSNWALNARVSQALAEELGDLAGKRVLDLYAGAGNFSLPLAGGAKEVVAVEENRHSIKDGERNAGLGGFKNFRFVEGRAESAKLKGEFEVALLDPPRPGLTKAAMDRVLGMAPQRVAYVSCNPSTLARDLKKLRDLYDVGSVRLIDFFPNTYHIEALAMLTRR